LAWININRTRPPNTTALGSRDAAQAGDRADLIKRLFAVAISVGAATTLYQMHWVQEGRAPCIAEYQQLFVLVAALTATVLSWDGYLWSIAQRPLHSFWRFAIDILLVFIYLLLLMTSKLLTWWLFIHALIYALYALWDFLSIKDWIVTYYPEDRAADMLTISGVYSEGLRDGVRAARGPIITIMWGLFFGALCIINYWALPHFNGLGLRDYIVPNSIIVILGLCLYRQDKYSRYTMWQRVAWIVILLLADVAYLGWLPTDRTLWDWIGPHIGSVPCPQPCSCA
jgi:hypothetical protein